MPLTACGASADGCYGNSSGLHPRPLRFISTTLASAPRTGWEVFAARIKVHLFTRTCPFKTARFAAELAHDTAASRPLVQPLDMACVRPLAGGSRTRVRRARFGGCRFW